MHAYSAHHWPNLPRSEKSSTRITSLTRWGGVRSSTLCTVRSSTESASLWKIITTLASGSTSRYFSDLHLYAEQTGQIASYWLLCIIPSYLPQKQYCSNTSTMTPGKRHHLQGIFNKKGQLSLTNPRDACKSLHGLCKSSGGVSCRGL